MPKKILQATVVALLRSQERTSSHLMGEPNCPSAKVCTMRITEYVQAKTGCPS